MTPTTRRAAVLLLALAAAGSARAQEATPATAPAPSPTTASTPATMTAPATATATAPARPTEAPTIQVLVGLGGLLSYQPACVPVRIDVAGGTKRFEGIVRLRSEQAQDTVYEIPVSAEPGARRRLHEVVCAAAAMQWSWSLDGAEWTTVLGTVPVSPPVVAIIGEDFGRIARLEEALGNMTPKESQTAILPPDSLPVSAPAWSEAPVVVLDARLASSLAAESLSALRDHVLAGGRLIVAGSEPTNVRADLVAAWPTGAGTATLHDADGNAFDVPALQFGGTSEWSAFRQLGAGRLVMLGIDLRDAAAREALTPDDWRALLGLSAGAQPPFAVGDPAWLPQVEAALDRDHDARASGSPLPPLIACAYLMAGGVALAGGSWLLGRRTKGIPRRRDVALLVAGIALPGFVVGFLRSTAAVVPTTVIEYWPSFGRSRVVSWTPVPREVVPLPPGASEGIATGSLSRRFPAARYRLGAQPSVHVADVPRFANLVVRTTEWTDMAPVRLASVRATNPPHLELLSGTGAVNAGAVLGPDMVLLGEIASAAASGGVGKGSVLLEKTPPGSPRVAWIVHEAAP